MNLEAFAKTHAEADREPAAHESDYVQQIHEPDP